MKTPVLAFFFLLFCISSLNTEETKTIPDTTDETNEPGTFVLKQLGNYRADRFMIDTKSGRVWQMTIDTDEILVFQPVLYQGFGRNNARTFSPTPIEIILSYDNMIRNNSFKNTTNPPISKSATTPKLINTPLIGPYKP